MSTKSKTVKSKTVKSQTEKAIIVECRQQGWDDWVYGKPFSANPYPSATYECVAWEVGWLAADTDWVAGYDDLESEED